MCVHPLFCYLGFVLYFPVFVTHHLAMGRNFQVDVRMKEKNGLWTVDTVDTPFFGGAYNK